MKTLKLDILKLEHSLGDLEKQENLLVKDSKYESDPNKRIKNTMEEQKKDVNEIGKSLNRTIATSTAAMTTLQEQKQQILGIIDQTHEAEKELSLHDQFFGVMANRELFNRLKLAAMAVLLFIAIILVIYIKFL